jgi:hypothetical protein
MQHPDTELRAGLLALGALVLGLGGLLLVFRHGPSEPTRPGARPPSDAAPGLFSGLFGGPGRAAGDAGTGGRLAAPFAPAFSGGGLAPVEEDDPQVLAMRRSFGDDAGMAADFTPYRHIGRATAAVGLDGVSPSARCDVRVLPVRSEGGFNCVVRVRCGDVTVYPDGALEAGYAPCDVERGVPTLATDRAPTERDGDPELLVDLDLHLVRVRDVRGERESLVEIRLD